MQLGRGGFARHEERQGHARELAARLGSQDAAHVKAELERFKAGLTGFAQKHKREINKDPELRRAFQQMTTAVGVDPLVSSKGFWSGLGIGDYYYELGVQIIDICMASRRINGGVMDMEDLLRKLRAIRGRLHQQVSQFDVERAVKKIQVFGDGFRVEKGGSRTLVLSVPMEMSGDGGQAVTEAASRGGRVTATELATKPGWSPERAASALDGLVRDGIAWVDRPAGGAETQYWLPSLQTAPAPPPAAASGLAAAGAGGGL